MIHDVPTAASPPPRNLDRAYDPEESTIIHDVLGSSLPDYAILAASRAAAQAIADHNSAERRAPRSQATVDDPPDLLTPASFSNDECIAVDHLIIAAAPSSSAPLSSVDECVDAGPLIISAAPSLDVAPAVPMQLDNNIVNLKQLADKLVHVVYLSCIGIVVALFASYVATTKLLAVELLRRA